MTTAIMLARVRTLLDESSAGFWTDTEIYAALAHSQISVINEILKIYKLRSQANPSTELPEELRVLSVRASGTISASYVAIPTGLIWLLNASWDHDATGGEKPCYIISQDRQFNFREDNPYLAAASTQPIAYSSQYQSGGQQAINFRPIYSTNGTYSIEYLKYPTAIASGQEPTLPESTHNAIIFYATATMLLKEEKISEAQSYFQNYFNEIKSMVGL